MSGIVTPSDIAAEGVAQAIQLGAAVGQRMVVHREAGAAGATSSD